ncbi:MAG: hypothetical protein SP4CHLAM5_09790 [Chlamydiia bacterium]|nr:hypothetical protein [Chlamydiia bacterium]MCH9618837.1 hypothetical protein [Chlamydiia bacterium]MCH9624361.1 hypothetical protein [Chlamydiia bacterium]
MDVNGPLRPQNSESRKTPSPDSVTKVIHIKGKAREKLIKATNLYTRIQSSLTREISDYSALKGRIAVTLHTHKEQKKTTLQTLNKNKANIKAMKDGPAKKQLMKRSKLLLQKLDKINTLIKNQENLLKTTGTAHDAQFQKYTGQLTKIEDFMRKFGKSIKGN